MKSIRRCLLTMLVVVFGCQQPVPGQKVADLEGAWRATLQFQTGPFAAVKDLEFLYVFNEGGTMTESSNYDSAPPVPPAYGIWKKLKGRQFEARYEFYITRQPTPAEMQMSGGGWLPSGRGVLTESITLSQDGNSFTSQVRFDVLDASGKPAEGAGNAVGHGTRMKF